MNHAHLSRRRHSLALFAFITATLLSGACSSTATPEPETAPPDSHVDAAPACVKDDTRCGAVNAGTIETCVENGTWESKTCDEVCRNTFGLASNGCDSTQCQCGDVLSKSCANGASGVCTCAAAAGQPVCTDDAYQALYLACFNMKPDGAHAACVATYVMDGVVDCQSAANGCPASP